MPSDFTFGIPLLPRPCALDWERIETLLALTLHSVFAQTDPDFRVVIAGHDRPECLPDEPRVEFLEADWPTEAVCPNNQDRGRKAHLINDRVRETGGGLLMFLDADDWVDRGLVAAARAQIGPRHVAGLIESGVAADFQTLRIAPIPSRPIFSGSFHRLCGSSSVLRISPGASDPLEDDPYSILHEHYRLPEVAASLGKGHTLVRLPVSGAYVINTGENHSENHGPYTSWRETFTRTVNQFGVPMDEETAKRFGLQRERLPERGEGEIR